MQKILFFGGGGLVPLHITGETHNIRTRERPIWLHTKPGAPIIFYRYGYFRY